MGGRFVLIHLTGKFPGNHKQEYKSAGFCSHCSCRRLQYVIRTACSTLFVLQPTIAAYEATGHKIEVSAISDAAGTEKQ